MEETLSRLNARSYAAVARGTVNNGFTFGLPHSYTTNICDATKPLEQTECYLHDLVLSKCMNESQEWTDQVTKYAAEQVVHKEMVPKMVSVELADGLVSAVASMFNTCVSSEEQALLRMPLKTLDGNQGSSLQLCAKWLWEPHIAYAFSTACMAVMRGGVDHPETSVVTTVADDEETTTTVTRTIAATLPAKAVAKHAAALIGMLRRMLDAFAQGYIKTCNGEVTNELLRGIDMLHFTLLALTAAQVRTELTELVGPTREFSGASETDEDEMMEYARRVADRDGFIVDTAVLIALVMEGDAIGSGDIHALLTTVNGGMKKIDKPDFFVRALPTGQYDTGYLHRNIGSGDWLVRAMLELTERASEVKRTIGRLVVSVEPCVFASSDQGRTPIRPVQDREMKTRGIYANNARPTAVVNIDPHVGFPLMFIGQFIAQSKVNRGGILEPLGCAGSNNSLDMFNPCAQRWRVVASDFLNALIADVSRQCTDDRDLDISRVRAHVGAMYSTKIDMMCAALALSGKFENEYTYDAMRTSDTINTQSGVALEAGLVAMPTRKSRPHLVCTPDSISSHDRVWAMPEATQQRMQVHLDVLKQHQPRRLTAWPMDPTAVGSIPSDMRLSMKVHNQFTEINNHDGSGLLELMHAYFASMAEWALTLPHAVTIVNVSAPANTLADRMALWQNGDVVQPLYRAAADTLGVIDTRTVSRGARASSSEPDAPAADEAFGRADFQDYLSELRVRMCGNRDRLANFLALNASVSPYPAL